jgi:hypothetical protein
MRTTAVILFAVIIVAICSYMLLGDTAILWKPFYWKELFFDSLFMLIILSLRLLRYYWYNILIDILIGLMLFEVGYGIIRIVDIDLANKVNKCDWVVYVVCVIIVSILIYYAKNYDKGRKKGNT